VLWHSAGGRAAVAVADLPRVAVSECLLGHRVRYDGRERRDPRVADTLADEFELVPICPEVGIGLPVPRDPVELRGPSTSPRMVVIATGLDLTARMRRWIEETCDRLDTVGICGLVVKGRSPSCGLRGVPVIRQGRAPADGLGLFAAAALGRWPALPVAESESLAEPGAVGRFRSQVRAVHAARRR